MICPTTPTAARAMGLKKYFTGKPCKRGHIAIRYASGSGGTCSVCMIAKANKWNKAHPEVNRRTQRALRGLPLPTRPVPLVCECCGKPCRRHLALDHCHVSGRFRGWLCWACNRGIGSLGDNLAGLKQAVAYLERLDG
jgi:Recombination endonuclease VII